jgi:hypothetical protein
MAWLAKQWGAILLLALSLSMLSTPLSAAADGIVVYYPNGCDYFVVETQRGYVLLEWYGGHDPSEGDRLVGN